jgi:hypothetical protein
MGHRDPGPRCGAIGPARANGRPAAAVLPAGKPASIQEEQTGRRTLLPVKRRKRSSYKICWQQEPLWLNVTPQTFGSSLPGSGAESYSLLHCPLSHRRPEIVSNLAPDIFQAALGGQPSRARTGERGIHRDLLLFRPEFPQLPIQSHLCGPGSPAEPVARNVVP